MDTITLEFNREAERTYHHQWLLWIIFFLIIEEEYARRKRLTHQENLRRKLACIPKP